jgi:hypothetical protein
MGANVPVSGLLQAGKRAGGWACSGADVWALGSAAALEGHLKAAVRADSVPNSRLHGGTFR